MTEIQQNLRQTTDSERIFHADVWSKEFSSMFLCTASEKVSIKNYFPFKSLASEV